MPDQPQIPLPEWVPPELENQFRSFGYNSQSELAQLSEKDRGVLLDLMTKQKKREHWVSGLDAIKSGQGHIPKEQIDHYFDRDIKEGEKGHGWGPDWKLAILRHPKTDLTPEVLNEIASNQKEDRYTRAAAWMHSKASVELPEDLRLSDFLSNNNSKQLPTISDEKLAQVINQGANQARETHQIEGGYPYNPVRDSYDATQLARILIEDNNRRTGGPKPITAESHPKTVDALVDYPQATVQALTAQNLNLNDKHVNRLLGYAQPTLKGQPVTDEYKEHLNRDLNNNPSGNDEQDATTERLQGDYYKENEKKDRILRALAWNQNLSNQSVDALANVASRTNEIGRATGAYDPKVLQRIASHPNISSNKQFELLSNPHDFIEKVRSDFEINRDKKSGRFRTGAEPEPAMMKPDVFNDHFPAMMQFFKQRNDESNHWESGDHINSMLEHPHVSPENIKWTYEQSKKDLAEQGKTSLAWPTLLNHPHTSEEIKRDMWHQLWNPSPKEAERLFRNATEGGKPIILADRARRMGISMLEGKVPSDLATDIVKRTDILDANLPSIGPEQHRIMLDRAKAQQYSEGAHNDNQFVLESVARHTTDPNLIREAHQRLKEWDWEPNEAIKMYKEGDRMDKNDLQHLHEPFSKNPNTPADVITKIHDDFPDANIMNHPNFPQERLEHFANLPEGTLPSIDDQWNRDHARNMLKDVDPDKYSYKVGGPGSNIATSQHLKGKDFGRVQAKPAIAKLRVFRDKILETDPAKGELSPKMLGQGPFGGNWKPVQEKNGNISAKKIQEHIDSQPSQDYNFSHETWHGAQRHSGHDQRVFKLNVTSDHIRQMKQAGVYDAFKKLSQYSEDSGHPSDAGHTLGWVRYEHHLNPADQEKAPLFPQDIQERAEHDTVHSKPEAIHVDEIQSDMGPNLIAKLRENPERAKSLGVDPDHIEKVHKIVFGNHHPSEVLMEAFRQHHRDQGRADIPIHILDAKTKAPISGQDVDDPKKPLPAHMQFTYTQMPKKMGFQPAKYGATAQQDNANVENGPTWTDKIRKFEEELINKALGDIKLGRETRTFPRPQQVKLPSAVGSGRAGFYDYNHLLTPQQKRKGYQLYVQHHPESKLHAKLFHKGEYAGEVEGIINPYNSEKLRIHSAHVPERHRGQGLGTALYEAVLGHARHSGFTSVYGGSHSTMAHSVHNKLAEKHGLAYRALPNYMEESYQHWPSQEEWEAAPTGPYDEKYGKYEYMIKSDSPFKAAGFKHKQTGQVIETGTLHDVGALPGEYDPAEWIEGFVDHQGVFHDRDQADKLAKLHLKKHHAEWQEIYKNEDGIVAMLEQEDPQERILALKSATVLPHHILVAINDEHPEVRAFAATHPIINGPLLMECLRQCKSPDAFELLLGHESCDDTHINYALETDWGGNGGPEDEDLA